MKSKAGNGNLGTFTNSKLSQQPIQLYANTVPYTESNTTRMAANSFLCWSSTKRIQLWLSNLSRSRQHTLLNWADTADTLFQTEQIPTTHSFKRSRYRLHTLSNWADTANTLFQTEQIPPTHSFKRSRYRQHTLSNGADTADTTLFQTEQNSFKLSRYRQHALSEANWADTVAITLFPGQTEQIPPTLSFRGKLNRYRQHRDSFKRLGRHPKHSSNWPNTVNALYTLSVKLSMTSSLHSFKLNMTSSSHSFKLNLTSSSTLWNRTDTRSTLFQRCVDYTATSTHSVSV